MSENILYKDKDERLSGGLDWSDKLAPGDSIVTSTWSVETGITGETPQRVGNITTIWFVGGSPLTWYVATNTVTTNDGETLQDTIRVYIKADVASQPAVSSALFPSKFDAVAAVRRDRLAAAAAGALPSVEISDEYIWERLLVAEAEIARELRVYLQPTKIVPDDAPQSEIDALVAAGEPWAQEPAYDYTSDFFTMDNWGYLVLKNKPLISIESIKFAYPSSDGTMWDVPKAWLRLDKRKGHVNMVPTSVGFAIPISGFVLQFMGGSFVPFLIQARYTAGLVDAARQWPDLVDVVKKKAVLGILSDAYLPQSGSISADGLSQSMSVDMSKYHDDIDAKINGPKGSNGGLRTAIHGITFGVLR